MADRFVNLAAETVNSALTASVGAVINLSGPIDEMHNGLAASFGLAAGESKAEVPYSLVDDPSVAAVVGGTAKMQVGVGTITKGDGGPDTLTIGTIESTSDGSAGIDLTAAVSQVFSAGPTAAQANLFVQQSGLGTMATQDADAVAITGGTINLAQTWNDAGVTFTGLGVSVTDTASAADSKLLDLQVGGASTFIVQKDGDVGVASNKGLWPATFTGGWVQMHTSGYVFINRGRTSGLAAFTDYVDGGELQLGSLGAFAWSANSYCSNSTDLRLYRDAANTLAQRNGTNAQEFRLYNTYTDASNYERTSIGFDAEGSLKIEKQAAGTGSLGSKLLDIGADGNTYFEVLLNGVDFDNATTGIKLDYSNANGVRIRAKNEAKAYGGFLQFYRPNSNASSVLLGDDSLGSLLHLGSYRRYCRIPRNGTFEWSYGDNNASLQPELQLHCGGDGILEQYVDPGASAHGGPQEYRLYNTYTDASNYERAFLRWEADTFKVGTEAAGTGASRNLSLLWNNGGLDFLSHSGGGAGTRVYTPKAGQVCIADTGNNNGFIAFGLGTASYAGLKGTGPAVAARLADDSGMAAFTAKKLTASGGAFTADEKLLDLAGTWNEGATTFTGIKLNITDTASAADSKLLDLQVGGTSHLKLVKGGSLVVGDGSNAAIDLNRGANVRVYSGDGYIWLRSGNGYVRTIQDQNALSLGPTLDVILYRDAANTLAQRNGTNAQEFRLYNTYTDASNYERAFLRWDADTLTMSVEGAGTGSSQRDVTITAGSGFANRLNLTKASTGGISIVRADAVSAKSLITSGGCVVATDSAGGASNLSLQLGVRQRVSGSGGVGRLLLFGANSSDYGNPAGHIYIEAGDHTSGTGGDGGDVIIAGGTAAAGSPGTVNLRRDTNPQTLNIYNAYTDASNYERGVVKWDANTFKITTEAAGTGSSRNLSLNGPVQNAGISLELGGSPKFRYNSTYGWEIFENLWPNTNGVRWLGHPTLSRGYAGLVLSELSSDPGDPSEGCSLIWQSNGTGSGDDGDIMMKITAGGVTKTITLADFSAF